MNLNRWVLRIAAVEAIGVAFFFGWRMATASPPTQFGGTTPGVAYDEGCNVGSANINGSPTNFTIAQASGQGYIVQGPSTIQNAGFVSLVSVSGKTIPIVARGEWVNQTVDCLSHAHML